MKVTVQIEGVYGATPTREQLLSAKGFVLGAGDYNSPVRTTIALTFEEGLTLLNDLVGVAKQHHDAVANSLAETGRLAALGDALRSAEGANVE